MSERRIVSPSLGLLVVIPLTLLLAVMITFVAFETAGVLEEDEPVANVSVDFADTNIECESEFLIAATHDGGQPINLSDTEISVQLVGSERENEIANLPLTGDSLEQRNIHGDGDLITDCAGGVIVDQTLGVVDEDEDNGANQIVDHDAVWTEGDQIIFALDDTSQVFIDANPTFRIEVVDRYSGDTLASEELGF